GFGSSASTPSKWRRASAALPDCRARIASLRRFSSVGAAIHCHRDVAGRDVKLDASRAGRLGGNVAEEDWEELVREAAQLRRAGRVEQAIAAYKRLLAIKPDLPDSWYNLAWLQRQARSFDDALASYGRALDARGHEPAELHRD